MGNPEDAMRRLTEQEMATLTNALSVAARKFSDNAKELRRGPPQRKLVATFEQQEKDTLALHALLDGATVDVTPAKGETGGVKCACGQFTKFDAYVYAHWTTRLGFECKCGRSYDVRRGIARPSTRGSAGAD